MFLPHEKVFFFAKSLEKKREVERVVNLFMFNCFSVYRLISHGIK